MATAGTFGAPPATRRGPHPVARGRPAFTEGDRDVTACRSILLPRYPQRLDRRARIRYIPSEGRSRRSTASGGPRARRRGRPDPPASREGAMNPTIRFGHDLDRRRPRRRPGGCRPPLAAVLRVPRPARTSRLRPGRGAPPMKKTRPRVFDSFYDGIARGASPTSPIATTSGGSSSPSPPARPPTRIGGSRGRSAAAARPARGGHGRRRRSG